MFGKILIAKFTRLFKYLLENSSDKSRSRAVHVRYLSQKYGLDDPLECLKFDPLSKSVYKELVQTKICAYYEKYLREWAANNSLMTYLHVSLSGLIGQHHPALSDIIPTTEVHKSRMHLKMLAGDYFTYNKKAN